MNDTKTPLDGFERRLLTALRSEIDTGEPSGRSIPSRRPRRHLVLAAATVATAATAIAVAAPTFFGSDTSAQAYSVRENDDGTVTATIYRYSDAAGLQQQLEDHGIEAVVQYIPPGKRCASPVSEPYLSLPASELAVNRLGDDAVSVTVSPAALAGHTLNIVTAEMYYRPSGSFAEVELGPGDRDSAGNLLPGTETSHGLGFWVTDRPAFPCELTDW